MCKHPNYSPIAIRFQRPRCLTQTFMYVRILLIKTGEGICDMSRRTLSLSLSLSDLLLLFLARYFITSSFPARIRSPLVPSSRLNFPSVSSWRTSTRSIARSHNPYIVPDRRFPLLLLLQRVAASTTFGALFVLLLFLARGPHVSFPFPFLFQFAGCHQRRNDGSP